MRLLRVPFVLAVIALGGCAAVYPELGTRTRPIPTGQPLDPAPPPELRWIRFVSGHVPERTRDGRKWQENGKASPYAKLLLNGVELFRTSVQGDTLSPTWPGSPHGNFKIATTDRLRVELWDSNPINDKPIGSRELGAVSDLSSSEGPLRLELDDSSADLELSFEPAHAVSGLGLWYELRTEGCAVTRLLEGSPSERAGLVAGDEVLRLGTRDVKTMSPDEIRSTFNAVPMSGLTLQIKHASGTVAELTLKEGPIYPSFTQFGPVD
jgi:C2 domain